MRPATLETLAREAGVPLEDIEYFLANHDKFRQWRTERSTPDFPVRESGDPDRRSKRVAEQAKNARRKQYDGKPRSVRTSDEIQPEIKTYLRELYTNDHGQMVCQACVKEMPFRLDDGSYYFKASTRRAAKLMADQQVGQKMVEEFQPRYPISREA